MDNNLKSNWNAFSDRLKEKFPALKDVDLKFDDTSENAVYDKIKDVAGVTKDEFSNLYNKFQSGLDNLKDKAEDSGLLEKGKHLWDNLINKGKELTEDIKHKGEELADNLEKRFAKGTTEATSTAQAKSTALSQSKWEPTKKDEMPAKPALAAHTNPSLQDKAVNQPRMQTDPRAPEQLKKDERISDNRVDMQKQTDKNPEANTDKRVEANLGLNKQADLNVQRDKHVNLSEKLNETKRSILREDPSAPAAKPDLSANLTKGVDSSIKRPDITSKTPGITNTPSQPMEKKPIVGNSGIGSMGKRDVISSTPSPANPNAGKSNPDWDKKEKENNPDHTDPEAPEVIEEV